MSVSHERVGDVLAAQGNLSEALESYRASLVIREQLAKANPRNAGRQRDLSELNKKMINVGGALGSVLPQVFR